MANKKGSKEAAAERRIQSLQLRIAGASFRAIGRQLGISGVQAYRDVSQELKRLAKDTKVETEELRTLELERLDALLLSVWKQAQSGNFGAIDRAVKIIERRCAILGINAASKVQVGNWRSEAIEYIRRGELSFEALAQEFDHDLATELFTAAGVPIQAGQGTPRS